MKNNKCKSLHNKYKKCSRKNADMKKAKKIYNKKIKKTQKALDKCIRKNCKKEEKNFHKSRLNKNKKNLVKNAQVYTECFKTHCNNEMLIHHKAMAENSKQLIKIGQKLRGKCKNEYDQYQDCLLKNTFKKSVNQKKKKSRKIKKI